jgi:hypothetical protein
MREASLVLIAEVRWKAGRMFTTSSSAVRINATSSGRKSAPAISIVASRESPDVNMTPFGAGLFGFRRRNFPSQIQIAKALQRLVAFSTNEKRFRRVITRQYPT